MSVSVRKNNLAGKRFGRLVAIARNGRLNCYVTWLCKCDCGNEVTVRSGGLVSGNTKSCGCLHSEVVSKRVTTHGLTNKHPLYKIWSNMRNRCSNPNIREYRYYGARGISVCKEWDDFLVFLSDMERGYSKGMSLDRINVNGNYQKDNCRWATSKEQGNNKRNNVLLTIDGVTKTISEWADISGIPTPTIYWRYKFYGWSDKEAVFTPVRGSRRNSKGTKLKTTTH